MKKLTLALLAVLFVAAAFPVAAANRQLDFTLVNQTGLAVTHLYISATSVNDWEEDVLGRDILPDGESVDITFSRSETSRLFDIKIQDEDGDTYEWYKIPLNEVNTLTISFDKSGTAIASWR